MVALDRRERVIACPDPQVAWEYIRGGIQFIDRLQGRYCLLIKSRNCKPRLVYFGDRNHQAQIN